MGRGGEAHRRRHCAGDTAEARYVRSRTIDGWRDEGEDVGIRWGNYREYAGRTRCGLKRGSNYTDASAACDCVNFPEDSSDAEESYGRGRWVRRVYDRTANFGFGHRRCRADGHS